MPTTRKSRSAVGKRRPSSRRWLERQHRDPYVADAQRKGYRSRAAHKLRELDAKFGFLGPGQAVLDLGAAPGGWSQIAITAVSGDGRRPGRVVAVDRAAFEPLDGATCLEVDLLDTGAAERIGQAFAGDEVDIVLSDMAPATIGHPSTDHLRIMVLAEAARDLASSLLKPGGSFVCKLFQGAEEKPFADALRRNFDRVRLAKPPSSRRESAEIYVVAIGFRGNRGC